MRPRGQVKFTWNATSAVNNLPVNFSAVLFSDGRIRFDYGGGNTGLTPTVGISAGDGQNFVLASYDGASTLTSAKSIEFDFVPGTADMVLTNSRARRWTRRRRQYRRPILHKS